MTTVPGGEHPGHLLTIFTLLWLVPLLTWRLHARWRRLTARQRISPRRTQIHLSLFTTLLAALAWLWRAQPSVLLHLAGGAVLGLALAWLSWRRTRLEPTRQGIFISLTVGWAAVCFCSPSASWATACWKRCGCRLACHGPRPVRAD